MLTKTRKQELTKLYYLDHFFEVLDFVSTSNRVLLEDCHLNFIEVFRSLDTDAQCLFVRLVNRKGKVFRVDKIGYDEISDLTGSIEQLREAGLIRCVRPDDCSGYLATLSKPDLIGLARDLLPTKGGLSSLKKSQLIETMLPAFDISFVGKKPLTPDGVVISRTRDVEYLFFLYFGRLEGSLTAIALRDLGLLKTRKISSRATARFSSREIASAAFHYRCVRSRIKECAPSELTNLVEEAEDWPKVNHSEVELARNREIYRLGREVERNLEPELALKVYRQSETYPATERTVRLLYQLGDRDQAESLLVRLIDNPSCDEELIFAEDFFERKFGKRKVGRLTEVLRGAEVLKLDESGRDYPELAAVSWFGRQGAKAFHVENVVWSQLFGVVFWDLLFDGENPAIHNDFDKLPAGLDSESFYNENREEIEDRLLQFVEPGWIEGQIEMIVPQMETMPNILLYPDSRLFEVARQLIRCSPEGSLELVLRDMVKNFRGTRSGFPDLLVFEDDSVKLVEIKSEGDQIQRHQLAQMERLRRAGFVVEVARIQWAVDPDQEYVVVDVETTGGNPSWQRVTEIGAVKIRNGEIIAEWSSLINPERKIPAKITSLTGITNEMVEGAPRFGEIADDFRSFLGDGVFAAHRVRFDFGFLREEFRRLEQDLRMPTFCTVVETRRYFPGFQSYSLANLCREFGIELIDHHRALCDAKAAAQILLKINEKRSQID